MAKFQVLSLVLLVGVLIFSFGLECEGRGFNGTLGEDPHKLLSCCKSTWRPDLCPHSYTDPSNCNAECHKLSCNEKGGFCKSEGRPVCHCFC
ncbi:hypothetical protein G4B88_000593 [Cannabis sativa]|uniref:Uncharacterized protein n=1 Tax=Cannabis sativa TaxID=3483 RepID=A0A7J6DZG2_CANSA|nr:hypothetical protein G4B88_000593 [Cannabis sativa]